MAKHAAELDKVFAALADPTRRGIVRQLGDGAASVSELASSVPIALPSFMKHIRTLETSGLIRTSKSGRVRRCELDRSQFALIGDWLTEQQRIWEDRTDRLEDFITNLEEGK
jgi:DNA-binding transcriptional ArsR family regulator